MVDVYSGAAASAERRYREGDFRSSVSLWILQISLYDPLRYFGVQGSCFRFYLTCSFVFSTFFGKFFTILVSSSSVFFLLVFSFVMAQFFVHDIVIFFDVFTVPTKIRTSMLLMVFTALGNHREIL